MNLEGKEAEKQSTQRILEQLNLKAGTYLVT